MSHGIVFFNKLIMVILRAPGLVNGYETAHSDLSVCDHELFIVLSSSQIIPFHH